MNSFLILLLGLAAVSAYPKNGVERIVGGSVTTINQYPQMAALLFSWGTTGHSQSCGGTIINNRSILTAAHCTIGDAPARWRSRVGSTNANSGGTILDSLQLINHPQYNGWTVDNDVSIIRVVGTIPFSNLVAPASIGTYLIGDNQVVWVTGWGRTASNGPLSEQLRHVQVWTVNQAVCRQRYAAVGGTVTDNMLCTGWLDVGGRDACQGDSGGPVFHNGVVVGVTSWGNGCALAAFPGVNARVSRFVTWISQNA